MSRSPDQGQVHLRREDPLKKTAFHLYSFMGRIILFPMSDIFFRAFCFLFMIVLAFALKKLGILKKEDGSALARVVLNITLPCALLVGFRTFVFDIKYLMIPLLSLLLSLLTLAWGYFLSRKGSREDRIYYMLSTSGYNIGNFVLPFVSGMLGASGVVAVCLFDMGNAIMCMGFNLMFLSMAISSDRKVSISRSLLGLFKKPSFTVYFCMIIISMLGLQLPDFIYELASSISIANGPLAMIMIGLMLEFSLSAGHVRKIVVVLASRLLVATVFAYLFYNYAPFDMIVRKSVAVVAFAPIFSASPAFTADFGGDTELSGLSNSISIVVSMAIIPVLLSVL